MGLYLPALHGQPVGDAVFVRDTSGSVFDETQQQFGAEIETVFTVLLARRLLVLDCDTRVPQVQCFERGDAIELAPFEAVAVRTSGGGWCRWVHGAAAVYQNDLAERRGQSALLRRLPAFQ